MVCLQEDILCKVKDNWAIVHISKKLRDKDAQAREAWEPGKGKSNVDWSEVGRNGTGQVGGEDGGREYRERQLESGSISQIS